MRQIHHQLVLAILGGFAARSFCSDVALMVLSAIAVGASSPGSMTGPVAFGQDVGHRIEQEVEVAQRPVDARAHHEHDTRDEAIAVKTRNRFDARVCSA